MFADTQSLIIKEYKGYLVLTKYNTPKIQIKGNGSLLSFFNKKDVHISHEALNLIKSKLKIQNESNTYALHITSKTNIFWSSHEGIIIPPDEPVIISDIPVHTLITDNSIDTNIKTAIDNHG